MFTGKQKKVAAISNREVDARIMIKNPFVNIIEPQAGRIDDVRREFNRVNTREWKPADRAKGVSRPQANHQRFIKATCEEHRNRSEANLPAHFTRVITLELSVGKKQARGAHLNHGRQAALYVFLEIENLIHGPAFGEIHIGPSRHTAGIPAARTYPENRQGSQCCDGKGSPRCTIEWRPQHREPQAYDQISRGCRLK